MKKKVLIVLSNLVAVIAAGSVIYISLAAGSREPDSTRSETGPITINKGGTIMISEGGTTVTIQGTPSDDGGCAYAFSAIAPGGSRAIDVTHKERPLQNGVESSGSMSPPAPGESGFSVRIGSRNQDTSTCTQVFELRPSETDGERTGGAPPFPERGPDPQQYTGVTTTIQGSPNETGGCEYSGSGSPRMISEDRSTCTAVIELGGSDGSWASSSATAGPPPASPPPPPSP